jgi:hypothetical protein
MDFALRLERHLFVFKRYGESLTTQERPEKKIFQCSVFSVQCSSVHCSVFSVQFKINLQSFGNLDRMDNIYIYLFFLKSMLLVYIIFFVDNRAMISFKISEVPPQLA